MDAQENPLANTVTYGVHKFHKFHTLTSHFYISRPIFLHRTSFDAWPDDLKRAMQKAVTEAVGFQRKLAVEEHEASRKAIEDAGCEIVELTRAGTRRLRRRGCSRCSPTRARCTARRCSSWCRKSNLLSLAAHA